MRQPPVDPDVLAVARGDGEADLVLRDARVVNVFTREIERGSIAVVNGRIAGVGERGMYARGREVVDLDGAFVLPGFIDAHMHVESTMLRPREFARLAAAHGTTGVVLDPHEIANVLGMAGIRWVMEDSIGAPLSCYFAASSCVPSSPLETSGAALSAADLASLFDDERVVALAEVMNFPGVVRGEAGVVEKVSLGLSRGRVVDGHAPGLSGRALRAYVASGVSTDHECTTIEEAREKLRLGMRVLIREGSAARNLEAILPLVTPANAHRFCFCTDDRHPADLTKEGHIDHVVRRAVALGLDAPTAVAMGSLHAAELYGLGAVGAVAPGYWGDIVVCEDLRQMKIREVYFRGRRVAGLGGALEGRVPSELSAADRSFEGLSRGESRGAGAVAPEAPVRLPAGFDEASLRVRASGVAGGRGKKIRVIGMDVGQIVTRLVEMEGKVEGGWYVSDPGRDLLKMAVIERHRGVGNIGLGFVTGFGFGGGGEGAIASTVGHDSHNLAVVGASDRDMAIAARTLAEIGGGQCVVRGGRAIAVLPLPIAGLMSDEPAEVVIQRQHALLEAAHEVLGCGIEDPFMPLSFLCLPVIPRLKLTDLGLVDVERFEVVPLEV